MAIETKFKYLRKRKRWARADTGQLVSKAEMARIQATERNQTDDPADLGFTFNLNRTPDSDAYRSIERLVGMGERGIDISSDPVLVKAADSFNNLVAYLDQDDMTGAEPYPHQVRSDGNWVEAAAADGGPQQAPPQPIPTGIRSAMTLSEYYYNTQGDVAQTVEAPIDLSISDLVISVPKDKGVEKRLRDLYSPENLNMREILFQIMLNVGVFGSAYPMEVPNDRDNPSEIQQVIQLPPKFMWVGYHIVSGMLMPENMPSPYAMRPWNGAPNWSTELAKSIFMPMTYNAFASGFNEQIVQGWGLPVNPHYLHPVRAKAFSWNRYPLPPMSRAFRSISTRAIYQELRRATLEGFKNQLWLFILGTKDAMPSPQEMAALKAAINGLSGVRTGNLAWRYGLDVQVKTPTPLQDSISNEVAQAFKSEIFGDLGYNIRMVTGNKLSMPGSGAGDSGFEIDVSVAMRRLQFIRKAIMEWEYLFRMRQADRWDGRGPNDPPGQARKALEENGEGASKVKFSRSLLEIAEELKQVVLPLYTTGLTSPQTALRHADEDYETELSNKDEFEPNRDKFLPPPSYNQIATGSGGETTSKPSQSSGRPPDSVSPNRMAAGPIDPIKLMAAQNDSETRKLYLAAILAILSEDLWGSSDVKAFIANLKAANVEWLDKIAREAYSAAGGVGTLDARRATLSADYVNSYADHFGQQLDAMIAAEEPIGTDSIRRRTLQYPAEGFKSAVVNATNQVMSERGASHWRRVLHPELSKSGPCPECVADSQVVHAMAEPFAVMHPGDVCATQELGITYFTSGGIPSIEVPTPNSGNELAQEIFGSRTLGKTRRKRVKAT